MSPVPVIKADKVIVTTEPPSAEFPEGRRHTTIVVSALKLQHAIGAKRAKAVMSKVGTVLPPSPPQNG